ncbi:MAG: transcription termination factor NusA [Anaerolineae bacterium]|jgi:N utilization substance protein A|nr:transcription termination factor NusA [Anaerolineae bacterium]
MKSEFSLAFSQICAEYNLPRDVVLEAVQAALVTAYRRDWKVAPTQNLIAEINMDNGLARIFLEKTVVAEVEDSETEIALQNAKRINSSAELEEQLMVDVTPQDFGRIAAQTAKQVITQRLREAERESQFNRFSRQENEIIIGTIQSIKPQVITLHLERTEEATMPKREQIPGERYRIHQKIRVYVLDVRKTPRGPQITVSRSHPSMLRRLLELEVPEIRSGQVEIKAIAREAGARSKIAVMSRQPGLDPVGACVGMRGIRIQTISQELNEERIDVIEWNAEPVQFIANALSMDKVLSVVVDETNPGGKTASVVVLDDQLSLAIGRSGQNARLAAKLTSWRVDIQGMTEAALWALEQVNETPELLASQKEVAGLMPRLATILRTHEEERYPYTDEECTLAKTVIEAVRKSLIAKRELEQPESRQTKARREAQKRAEVEKLAAKQQALKRVPEAAYQIPLASLSISEKVLGHLTNGGINNVGEIMERIALGDEALLMLNGIGAKALNEIKEAIENSPFTLKEARPDSEGIAEFEEAFLEPAPEAAEAVPALLEEDTGQVSLKDMTVDVSVEAEAEVAAAEKEPTVEGAAQPEEPGEIDTLVEVPVIAGEERMDGSVPEPMEGEELLKVPADLGIQVYEEEEEDTELLDETSKGKKKSKKRSKAIFYDDDSGETYVVRKRRRIPGDIWDDFVE